MEQVVEWALAGMIVITGPLLTIFDLPGNTLLMLTALGFAFYDEALYFNGRILSAMIFIYALGECWEFCVSLFGIKRHDTSWFAVALIGLGGFVGTILGTGVLPVLGSFIGGIMGAYAVAFLYEYLRSGRRKNAFVLATRAAKTRFLALIGKLAAGLVLAILLVRQIFLV